ncbi:hypothetical protein I2486_19300 [Cellulophaga sp. E16_2]|uniref:hypothetical protein n=1 Tax=unclassified Cellulophaga TaxID=2634405 RepID=UPI0013FD6FA2|nr:MULTISPECIES: hypothetical protein [unclassified Cellulophaga]MBO0593550.1 hypothetical protein [Cellulophaga sp. E16_2]
MWFEKLTGFKEISHENVQNNIHIDEQTLVSTRNGKSYQFGALEIVSLEELRIQCEGTAVLGTLKISEIVADIQDLHCDLNNNHALFQAASQFNLLEMVDPFVTPEKGIAIYENDFTQGPACAIACGAGTIYRNYFLPIANALGQTSSNQIDCLDAIGKELNNEQLHLWEMKNGYALVHQNGLLAINKQLSHLNNSERERLKGKLKVGIQWNTEVTLIDENQIVSQVYCSALPVAYSQIDFFYWENFARIILEATYEASLCAAKINMEKGKSNKVFLTLVGGGAFGNDIDWILESLIKAIEKFKNVPLAIKVVSYGTSNILLKEALEKYNC